jgi:histidine triad (HIT) family protein
MGADPNCIFCRIAAGEIPAALVHETEQVVAFLDIAPLAEGHLLLIPRAHFARLEEVPGEVAAALASELPRLGRAVRQVTGAQGYNLLVNDGKVAGQEVEHVHFHLIPRAPGDGLGYRWIPGSYRDDRARELQSAYREALGGSA